MVELRAWLHGAWVPGGAVSVLLVIAACASAPGDPDFRCKTVDDCRYVPPCSSGATCVDGTCRYQARQCDAPPAPECVENDTVYRVYRAPGTCQVDAGDGQCKYLSSDLSCPGCSANCLGTCQGMSCTDLQHGCRTAGRCVPGSPPTCMYDAAAAEQACDDADLCTYGDHCDGAGHCAASTVSCVSEPGTCGKHRKCNGTATCDEWFPGADVACDDGSGSTYSDHCDGAGHCVGSGVTCTSDPGPCGAVRTANGTATCAVTYPGASTTCSDGNAATYGDHCDGAGRCVGAAITCTSDPGPCGAIRTANGTSSCAVSYPGASTACDDGKLTTYGDHCDGAGGCTGTAITCTSDSGPCGATRTANGTASCTVTYPPATTACNDGVACTKNDHCNGAGACTGTAYSCGSGDGCGSPTCDGVGGCGWESTSTDGQNCGVVQGAGSCSSCSSGHCHSGCINGMTCKTPANNIWVCM